MRISSLVTVCIPAYNEAQFIGRAIEALKLQTMSDFKVLLSDNCSTDSTFEIAYRLCNDDNRFTLFKQSSNIGASANFNFLLERVHAKYLVFLGAHDWFHSTYLSKLVELLESTPKCVLAYPRITEVGPTGSIRKHLAGDIVSTENLQMNKMVELMVGNMRYCSMMYGVFRATALAKCKHNIVCYGTDQVMLYELSLHGSIILCQESLYFMQIMNSINRDIKSHDDQIASQLYRIDPMYFSNGPRRVFWLFLYNYICATFRVLEED